MFKEDALIFYIRAFTCRVKYSRKWFGTATLLTCHANFVNIFEATKKWRITVALRNPPKNLTARCASRAKYAELNLWRNQSQTCRYIHIMLCGSTQSPSAVVGRHYVDFIDGYLNCCGKTSGKKQTSLAQALNGIRASVPGLLSWKELHTRLCAVFINMMWGHGKLRGSQPIPGGN